MIETPARLTVAAMNATKLGLTLAVAATVALSACGGGSDGRLSASDYKKQLAVLDRQDKTVHASVDNLPHAKSVAQMKAGLAAFAAGEQRIGAQVAALKPPKDAQSANAALAKGFTDSAAEMKRIVTAIQSAKSPRQALQIIGKQFGSSTKGGNELDSALAQLKRLGYTKGD
jgi:hypothetical protein